MLHIFELISAPPCTRAAPVTTSDRLILGGQHKWWRHCDRARRAGGRPGGWNRRGARRQGRAAWGGHLLWAVLQRLHPQPIVVGQVWPFPAAHQVARH